MKKIILLLVGAALVMAAQSPMNTYMRKQSGGAGNDTSIVIIDTSGAGALIHDSLNANGIGDEATRTLNAKAFLGLGSGTSFTTIGTSYCNGSGSWVTTAAGEWNFIQNNLCEPGARVQYSTIQGRAMQQNPTYSDKYILEVLTNDVIAEDPTRDVINAYSAIPYFLAVPESRKSYANSATYSGTWALDTLHTRVFRKNTVSGSYAEFSVTGKWVVVGLVSSTTPAGGDVQISVNGAPYTTFDSYMSTDMAPTTEAFAAIRLGPFPADVNTIRITNNENGAQTALSWWYGIGRDEVISGPRILSHGCIYAPYFNNVANMGTLCNEYTAAMDSVHQEMREAGIPIQWAGRIDLPNAAFIGDSIHFTALGMQLVTDTMYPHYYNATVQQAIDQFSSIGSNNEIVYAIGDTGASGCFYPTANKGLTDTDKWRICAKANGYLNIETYATGAWVSTLSFEPTARWKEFYGNSYFYNKVSLQYLNNLGGYKLLSVDGLNDIAIRDTISGTYRWAADQNFYSVTSTSYNPGGGPSSFGGNLTTNGLIIKPAGSANAYIQTDRPNVSYGGYHYFSTNLVNDWVIGTEGASGDFIFNSYGTSTNALTLARATGAATFINSVSTGAPTTGTAAPWKLGSIVTAACVLDATTYTQVEVNGVFRKVALCQ